MPIKKKKRRRKICLSRTNWKSSDLGPLNKAWFISLGRQTINVESTD